MRRSNLNYKKSYMDNLIKTDVTILAGPPGSGKTTYAMKHKTRNDLIVDMDYLYQALTGLKFYDKPDSFLPFVCEARDAVIERLKRKNNIGRAFIVGTYPEARKRENLASELKAKVIVLKPDKKTCIERIKNDDIRQNKKKHIQFVEKWFNKFEPTYVDQVIDNS